MKDFAGSSVTYYGLAREKLINKYPWLVNVLIILALVCMTGLAIYLISDLVSFVSDSDFKGASIDPNHNGPEKDILSAGKDTEDHGNIGTNSSLNTSLQTKELIPSNLSKINSSLSSGQAGTGVLATSKPSSISVQSSVNKKSGNPSTSRRSSSSSSSSKSSSANPAKISGETNNQTNETAAAPLPANETAAVPLPATEIADAPLPANETAEVPLPATEIADAPLLTDQPISNSQDNANSTITGIIDLSSEGQGEISSEDDSSGTQEAEVAPITAFSSLPSAAIISLTGPAGDKPANEPVSMIQFKTEPTLSPESEQENSPGSGASTDGASVSDSANKAKRTKTATKNIKFETDSAKSTAAKKSKVTASSQAAKVKEAKEKMQAKKDIIEQNMKKKAAQMRSKAK